MIMSPTDENIRNQGFNFVPFNQYLASPFQLPTSLDDTTGSTSASGITTINQPIRPYVGGGGMGDMIRTDYRPDFDFRQYSEYGLNPSTADIKQMDMNQEYFYGKPPSGLEQLASKAFSFVPVIGPISRVASFLSGKMPVNQRSILENELRGQGVFVDDIGRIVAGPGGYNTPEGIMAGYNAAQMSEKTFDKRTDRIGKTLADKYGIDISTLTDEEIENFDPTLDAANLVNRYNLVEKAKKNFLRTQKKASDIAAFRTQEKAAAKSRAESKRQYDPAVHGPTNYGLGSDGKQSYDSGMGFGINATTGGPVSNKSGRGRTDYMDGGLADLVDIYD